MKMGKFEIAGPQFSNKKREKTMGTIKKIRLEVLFWQNYRQPTFLKEHFYVNVTSKFTEF